MLKCHEECLLESGNFNLKRRMLMGNYENCCISEKFIVFFMRTVQTFVEDFLYDLSISHSSSCQLRDEY